MGPRDRPHLTRQSRTPPFSHRERRRLARPPAGLDLTDDEARDGTSTHSPATCRCLRIFDTGRVFALAIGEEDRAHEAPFEFRVREDLLHPRHVLVDVSEQGTDQKSIPRGEFMIVCAHARGRDSDDARCPATPHRIASTIATAASANNPFDRRLDTPKAVTTMLFGVITVVSVAASRASAGTIRSRCA